MVLYAECEKKTIAVEFLKIDLELFEIFSFLCVKMFFFTDSHENSHAVGTRFHYFPVIVGQPNLVSSFLTIFPRVVFRNIPEKSNPPSEKTVEILQFSRLFGPHLVQDILTFLSS